MIQKIYVNDSTVAFNTLVQISYPILLVANGIDVGEVIKFSVAKGAVPSNNSQSFIDDDNNWIDLLESANIINLNKDTNQLFIQTPAIYRMQLDVIPTNPITIVGYQYT